MRNDVTSRSINQNKKLPFNTFQRNRTSVMIGMEGEIQFVCFRVYNNKHINCFSLLIEGKDPVRCRYIYMVAEIKKVQKCKKVQKSKKIIYTFCL